MEIKKFKLIVSFLHAAILLILFLFFIQMPRSLSLEISFLRIYSVIRQYIFFSYEKPDPERFLFVSLSYDKKIIDKTDANGFVIGNQTITDRQKITQFLQILNQKPDNHTFLLLDVSFEEKSPYDSLLSIQLAKTKNYLVSYSQLEEKMKMPFLSTHQGLSVFETNKDGIIVKYSPVQLDTVKTTPLLMYEQLHQKHYKPGWFLDMMDNKLCLKSFNLNYRLWFTSDSMKYNSEYKKVILNELLNSSSPEEIQLLTKDKIIVAGDFEDLDIHETLYGKLPGSIILLNAFLALEHEDNRLSLFFLLTVFITYTYLSYICLSNRKIIQRKKSNFVNRFLGKIYISEEIRKILSGFIGTSFFLFFVSFITYSFFNISIDVFYTTFYFQLLGWIIQYRSNIRKLKDENTLLDGLVNERTLELKEKNRLILLQNLDVSAKAQELEEKNLKITELNNNLEKVVEKRTQQLQQINDDLETFLYRSYHDFSGPLRTIIGLCNLGKYYIEYQDVIQLLDKINFTSLKMDKLLTKLKQLLIIGSKEQQLETEDVRKQLELVKETFQQEISDKHIKFTITGETQLPIRSYSELLQICLQNLIENAVIFSDPLKSNPFIKIELKDMPNSIEIIISDNGIGINKNHQYEIFEKFFRGSEQSEGNGLGLYLVKIAIEVLKGSISFQSTPNVGSTFIITLPKNIVEMLFVSF